MHRLVKFLFLPLWFLGCSGPAGAAGTDPGTPVATIDLTKTRELYARWAQRKSFPDTVTLASYNAYSVPLLNGALSNETKGKLVDLVKASQQDDGGFRSNPQQGGKSNVTYTYFALETLRLAGAPDVIERGHAVEFVKGLIDEGGGARPAYSDQSKPSLTATYYAVESLHLLSRLELLHREKTSAFILAHRTSSGGFGMRQSGAASPQSTYMALAILARLGTLSAEVGKAGTEYLENSIGLLGLTGPRSRAHSTIEAAYYIASGLSLLQALNEVETTPIEHFVMGLYVPENGGFGPSPGYGTTPPSTYYGIRCLNTLGKLHPTNGTASLAAVGSGSLVANGVP